MVKQDPQTRDDIPLNSHGRDIQVLLLSWKTGCQADLAGFCSCAHSASKINGNGKLVLYPLLCRIVNYG